MSARSTISVLAWGMSIPDSMIEVETSTSASPRRNASIRCSSSVSSICPWATSKRICGTSAAQPLGRLVDRLDPVVQEERLAAARVLAQQRRLDELLVVLADVGLDRAAALRRGLDHADVADPGQRHLQRPRDRRRAHRDHVDLQLHLLEQLLLLDAEALLLVDDQQTRGPWRARRARAAGGCRSGCPPRHARTPRSPPSAPAAGRKRETCSIRTG